jgi:hypothetical protein
MLILTRTVDFFKIFLKGNIFKTSSAFQFILQYFKPIIFTFLGLNTSNLNFFCLGFIGHVHMRIWRRMASKAEFFAQGYG